MADNKGLVADNKKGLSLAGPLRKSVDVSFKDSTRSDKDMVICFHNPIGQSGIID